MKPIPTAIASILTLIFGLWNQNTLAQEINRIAQKRSTPIETIAIAHGKGVTISFTAVGEIVTHIWIDNPTFLTINTNGCLSGLSQECETEGASIVHLRRIEQIKIPFIKNATKTLITIITNENIYLFKVTQSQTTTAHIIDIVPNETIPIFSNNRDRSNPSHSSSHTNDKLGRSANPRLDQGNF